MTAATACGPSPPPPGSAWPSPWSLVACGAGCSDGGRDQHGAGAFGHDDGEQRLLPSLVDVGSGGVPLPLERGPVDLGAAGAGGGVGGCLASLVTAAGGGRGRGFLGGGRGADA